MPPSSEDLEAFHDRVRVASAKLAKIGGKELTKAALIGEVADIAREWLQLSHQLRDVPGLDSVALEVLAKAMGEALASTKGRVRASALKKRLDPLVNGLVDQVVVPLIKFEGSPAQVAARQLQSEFSGKVTADEMSYVEEAARCLSQHCHRAAIILLWAAGMARLHQAVQKVGFDAFHGAVAAVNAKKGAPYTKVAKGMAVSSLADLQRSRDYDLLVVGMEVWRYDLQALEELERLLGQRNSAAHPGLYQPNGLEVQQFASKLSRFIFGAIPA